MFGGFPRPLLIALSCNPEWVSVPLEGWSHTQAIARVAPGAHVVTQVRNRDALTRAGLVEGRDFTSIDTERLTAPLFAATKKLRGGNVKGWTLGTAASALVYPHFERRVWKWFRPRLQSGEFNIVHRVTPLTPTMVSPIALRCSRIGVPFVIGPLNGGLPWPPGSRRVLAEEREWLSYVRAGHKLMPGYRSTRRCASAVIVGSQYTMSDLGRYRDKCVYIPENAVDPVRFTLSRTRRAERPLRLVFVGRLVPYKGLDILIEAIAPLARAGAVDLEVIGSGPQEQAVRELIRSLGLVDRVRLVGFIPHAELQSRLADRDVLAFPSIREFGGAVVLEAMAVGLVPVVVNYGGPGELVTDQTGFRVPMCCRSELIERFRVIIADLSEHPETVDQMSPLSRRRVFEQFTWDAKAAEVMRVYQAVLNRTPLPTFPMPVPDLDP